MKILYIYDKMPGTYQKYLLNLLNEVKKKFEVKTLTYEKSDNTSDYSVIRYGYKDYFQFLLYTLKISGFKSIDAKYISKYDVIHVQHSFLWRKFEYLKGKKNIPKIIITLRGGDTFIKPWLFNSWKDFYKNETHIAAFVVMSHYQKKYLENWGVNSSKIHVIPISFGTFSSSEPKLPNKRTLKLVSAFRMTWEKNIEGTIFFAKIMKEKGITFSLDIYGDGKDLGQLFYFIEYYKLNDCVFVKGKIENDKLKRKLSEYDFFLQLSYSEAFPTSVLEAQSLGVPCIVSDAGGLPEAVIKDETALIENYKDVERLVDQAIELWKDKNRYYEFSQKAIDFVNNNFSIEKEIERLTNLYNTLSIK